MFKYADLVIVGTSEPANIVGALVNLVEDEESGFPVPGVEVQLYSA